MRLMFSLKPTCLKTIKAKRNNCPLLGDIFPSDVCAIAYFSAEYGLHRSLPFYAGGLGRWPVTIAGSALEMIKSKLILLLIISGTSWFQ